MDTLSKEILIKKEKERLNKTFSKLSEDTQSTVLPLIDKVAFMSVTLDDLQNEINKNGFTETYLNELNQIKVNKSVLVDVYETMFKNYSMLMKYLNSFLPKEQIEEDDGFDDL